MEFDAATVSSTHHHRLPKMHITTLCVVIFLQVYPIYGLFSHRVCVYAELALQRNAKGLEWETYRPSALIRLSAPVTEIVP